MQLKELVPPLIYRMASRMKSSQYGWSGDYSSWQEAVKNSSGYNSEEIVQKVKDALLKVVNGEAAFERDSVVFSKHDYDWPVVAGLLWSAARKNSELNVLDFGGSLGTIYFQNRSFFQNLTVNWGIVEQELFVTYGEKYFPQPGLRFYASMEKCVNDHKRDVFLFSSVLQYMERPFDVLQQAFHHQPELIIIDKMPFLDGDRDRITVQNTDPAIYQGSYPCWLLSRERFLKFFSPAYECVSEFTGSLSIRVEGQTLPYEGFLFRRTS